MARGGSPPPQEDAWLSSLCLPSPWIYLLATSLPCHVCFQTVDEPGVAWPMSSLPFGLLGALSSGRCRAGHSPFDVSQSLSWRKRSWEMCFDLCQMILFGFLRDAQCLLFIWFRICRKTEMDNSWGLLRIYHVPGSKVLQNWGKMYQVSGWSVLDWPPLVVLNSHTSRSSEFNKWDPNTLNSFCRGKEIIDRMKKQPNEWEKVFAGHVSHKG